MMYHFIFGLRGFSATAVASFGCDGVPSAWLLVFCSSCISWKPEPLFCKPVKEDIHAPCDNRIDDKEVETEQEDGDDYDHRGRLHLFERRRRNLPHLGAYVVIEGLDPLGDGLYLPTKAVVVCCGC